MGAHLSEFVLMSQYMQRELRPCLKGRAWMKQHFYVALGRFDVVAVDGEHVDQGFACSVPAIKAH